MHEAPQTSIRTIAIDMDGTLLGDDGQVSPRNLAALVAAQAAGIEIAIATGRRHSYAMRILRPLGLPHAGALISSNGAVTRTLGSFGANPIPSQLIARTHLSRATALWLCDHLRGLGDQDFRNALVLTFDRVGPDGDDTRGALVVEHLAELNASIGRWMTANEPYIAHINPIERALDPNAGYEACDISSATTDPNHHAPIQAMLCGTVARMARAEARLLEHPGVHASGHEPIDQIPGAPSIPASSGWVGSPNSEEPILTLHRTVYPGRDLSILDILPPNCSKGAAILSFAAARNIDPTEILAIGDNWNDVSMLEVAGHSVLMANAPEDLQALARTRNWRIGLANTADGVAEAIESALTVSCP
jgi:hydroxymethylpyrimidine pyrophosphatase-like HAD family hydrolase